MYIHVARPPVGNFLWGSRPLYKYQLLPTISLLASKSCSLNMQQLPIATCFKKAFFVRQLPGADTGLLIRESYKIMQCNARVDNEKIERSLFLALYSL